MHRIIGSSVALVLAIACHTVAAQDATQSVSVTVAGTKSHASDLAQAAIIAQGYAIESATDNAIVSTPSGVRGGWSKYRTVVHAGVLGVGSDSVRVVISEVATGIARPLAGMELPAGPVTVKQKKEYAEMQAIRDAIGTSGGDATHAAVSAHWMLAGANADPSQPRLDSLHWSTHEPTSPYRRLSASAPVIGHAQLPGGWTGYVRAGRRDRQTPSIRHEQANGGQICLITRALDPIRPRRSFG
jgi:hypothetical protein